MNIQQEVPTQVTIIPAESGWAMAFYGGEEIRYQPIVAWEVRSFAEPRRVPDVRPLTFDSMANGVSCQLLRDPQGVLRTICTAYGDEVSFSSEAEALAYLKEREDRIWRGAASAA
jgi:hypothetical protein